MADYQLEPFPFLWGKERYFGDNYLDIVSTQAIVSIAIPRDNEDVFASDFTNAFGSCPPEPGHSVFSQNRDFLFLWMSPDQVFTLFERDGLYPELTVREKLGNTGYITDQTDNWCQIRLSGPDIFQAMERICPLDLNNFQVGKCARTVMEHLSSVLVRESEEGFLLLSPSSSAQSFLEAIEQSFFNTGDY
ncbi:MAG: sarcosine oxidase subunit gamma [Rhodobacteraceae bacterium]|nr:sarcosine oxidase subunit gamma [Paracoccaceae bacterium]MCY4250330.1 sarcosine oxidase subunit gamma [Paracoccaceae bacterium]